MTANIIADMIKTNGTDTRRIGHALKVLGLARCIAQQEGLSSQELTVLEAAAVLHDIGIRYCEQTFGKCTGKMQEQYGPKIAEEILDKHGISAESKERVLFLIAHHHTYECIDGIDYQILIEADFLVNCEEGDFSRSAFAAAFKRYFKTKAGKQLAKLMFEF